MGRAVLKDRFLRLFPGVPSPPMLEQTPTTHHRPHASIRDSMAPEDPRHMFDRCGTENWFV